MHTDCGLLWCKISTAILLAVNIQSPEKVTSNMGRDAKLDASLDQAAMVNLACKKLEPTLTRW